jgi:uncharacterized membrane protein
MTRKYLRVSLTTIPPVQGAPLLRPLHPLHAILLAGSLTLFLGVLVTDLAYYMTYEVQWKNFASWLLVGALVFGGFVMVWALVDLVRLAADRGARRIVYAAIVVVLWILGFLDSLVHAGDAWGSMPAGLILSAILVALALAATWIGFANYRPRVTP